MGVKKLGGAVCRVPGRLAAEKRHQSDREMAPLSAKRVQFCALLSAFGAAPRVFWGVLFAFRRVFVGFLGPESCCVWDRNCVEWHGNCVVRIELVAGGGRSGGSQAPGDDGEDQRARGGGYKVFVDIHKRLLFVRVAEKKARRRLRVRQ